MDGEGIGRERKGGGEEGGKGRGGKVRGRGRGMGGKGQTSPLQILDPPLFDILFANRPTDQ